MLYEQAVQTEKSNPDSAILIHQQIIEEKEWLKKNPELVGKSYRKLALLTSLQEQNNSLELCEKAIAIFTSIKNDKEVGITYNSIANIYQRKGYFDLSIQYYLKAAAIFERIQFYKGLLICYSNIASIYNSTEQPKQNLIYTRLAYATSLLDQDSFSTGMIAHDLSLSFLKNNQTDSAKILAEKAAQIGTAMNDNFVLAYANKALTDYFLAVQDWNEAKSTAKQYLHFVTQTTSDYDICQAYLKNAEVDLKTNKLNTAKLFLDSSLLYANKVPSFQLYKKVYALYKDYYSKSGDYKNAYLYAQLFQQYNDSVFSERRNNTLNELETKYQTAKKETQIAQQQIKIKQSQTRFIIILIILIVLAVMSVLLYFFFRQRQTLLQNRLVTIEQQKKLELAQAIMDGEEQERMRLAKELHDGIGGLMSMIKLQFSNITKSNQALKKDNEYLEAMNLLNSTTQDIRRISHALMPSALERLGLVEAVAQFCTQAAQSSKLDIDFQHYGLEERLPAKTELLIYRIVQELLNNILKYAEAREILVQISKNNQLLAVSIEDDGKGFDVSILKNKEGIGLRSMQQRVELLGGKMDIDSAEGNGTAINIELPIQ